jgi:hypothetical protein
VVSWSGVVPLGLCCCWRLGGGGRVAVCRSVHLTCVAFINTNKPVVFDVPYPLLIVTYTTGMSQLRVVIYTSV